MATRLRSGRNQQQQQQEEEQHHHQQQQQQQQQQQEEEEEHQQQPMQNNLGQAGFNLTLETNMLSRCREIAQVLRTQVLEGAWVLSMTVTWPNNYLAHEELQSLAREALGLNDDPLGKNVTKVLCAYCKAFVNAQDVTLEKLNAANLVFNVPDIEDIRNDLRTGMDNMTTRMNNMEVSMNEKLDQIKLLLEQRK